MDAEETLSGLGLRGVDDDDGERTGNADLAEKQEKRVSSVFGSIIQSGRSETNLTIDT